MILIAFHFQCFALLLWNSSLVGILLGRYLYLLVACMELHCMRTLPVLLLLSFIHWRIPHCNTMEISNVFFFYFYYYFFGYFMAIDNIMLHANRLSRRCVMLPLRWWVYILTGKLIHLFINHDSRYCARAVASSSLSSTCNGVAIFFFFVFFSCFCCSIHSLCWWRIFSFPLIS